MSLLDLIRDNGSDFSIITRNKRDLQTPFTGKFTQGTLTLNNPKPIQLACLFKRTNIVAEIGKYVDVDIISQIPPLHISIILSDIPTIDVLIALNANKNILYNGLTPLHTALRYSNFNTFQYCLMKGFDPFTYDPNGDTVIHAAIKFNKIEIVQLLISMKICNQSGVPIYRVKNIEGFTPLELSNAINSNIPIPDQEKFSNDDAIKKLKERVSVLENAVRIALDKLPNDALKSPGLCSECKKQGTQVCPVCHKVFCKLDWITHVMDGCK